MSLFMRALTLLLTTLFIAINVSGESNQSLKGGEIIDLRKTSNEMEYYMNVTLITGLIFLVIASIIMSFLGFTGNKAETKSTSLGESLPTLRAKVEELDSSLIGLKAEKMAYTMRNREYKQIRAENHARIMKVIEAMEKERKLLPTQDATISIQNHRKFRGNIMNAKKHAELERLRFQELLNKTATDLDISKGIDKNRALDRAKNLEDQQKMERSGKLSRIRRKMFSYIKPRRKSGRRDIERGLSTQQDENYSARPTDTDDQSSNPERAKKGSSSHKKDSVSNKDASKRPAEAGEQASNMKRLQIYDARSKKEAKVSKDSDAQSKNESKVIKGNDVDSVED